MRKLVASLIFIHALAALSKLDLRGVQTANSDPLEAINRSLKQLDDATAKTDKADKAVPQESNIRLEQTQKVVSDIKKMLKNKNRKLGGANMVDDILNSLDKYLNYVPKKLGINPDTRVAKAASLVGQGLLVKGLLSRRKRNRLHVVMVRELTTKMKARELYINSVERNKSALQTINQKLSSQPDYFSDKKNSLNKFFNSLINYSE